MNVLTIDVGTTNTRVCIWADGAPIANASVAVGVRDTAITGTRTALEDAISTAVSTALNSVEMPVNRLSIAIASGMITSNLGLHEVPHLTAPVNQADLAAAMVKVELPGVLPIPIWFIPGVRNVANGSAALELSGIEAVDMMRGEEAEAIGLLARLDIKRACVLALPGSHSKYVAINSQKQIVACMSTLAGELLQAVTQHTILTKSLNGSFASELRPDFLIAGAAQANKVGFARACFTVRTLDAVAKASPEDCANYLLGAALWGDLLALKNSTAFELAHDCPIYVAGNGILSQALAMLMAHDDRFRDQSQHVPAHMLDNLAGYGALQIFNARSGATR